MTEKRPVEMPIDSQVTRMLDWDIQAQPKVPPSTQEDILRVEHLKMYFPVTQSFTPSLILSEMFWPYVQAD